jgi:hypothetical protein
LQFNTYSQSLEPDEDQSRRIARGITYHPEPQQQIDVFDDAYFCPGSHCIFDRDGNRVDASLQWRDRRHGNRYWPGGVVATRHIPQDAPVCHHPVVYLGVLFPHYGHFMLECTARLWALRQLLRDEGPVKFLYSESSPGSFWRDGYVTELMHLAGIPLDNFVFLNTFTRLRRVFVPHATFDHETEGYSNHADVARLAAERVLRGKLPPLSEQPLYISRTRYQSQPWEIARARYCLNEFELEQTLRDAGFAICHAEMLSLQQKIVLYNSHRTIIGHRGSGLLTTLFCLNGKRQEIHDIYEAGHANGLFAYSLIDLITGMSAYYIGTAVLYLGDILDPERHPDGSRYALPEGHQMHRIDLRGTLAWLTQRGLMPARPHAAAAPAAGATAAATMTGTVLVHLQDYGDTTDRDSLSGGRRHSRRYVTGLCLALDDISNDQLEYQIITEHGDVSDWAPGGTYCGTRGVEKPLLGFAARLKGPAARQYGLRYAASFVGVEDLVWAADGALCRASTGAPLEAFKLFVDIRRG